MPSDIKVDIDKAKTTVAKDREDREKSCSVDIQAILDKYNCNLECSILLKSGQVLPNISIVSK